jgi:TonB family protein
MKSATMAGLAATLIAAAAWAAEPTVKETGVVPPSWRHKPTAADLIQVWPREALRNGVSGRAVITCVVTVQGALRDCLASQESPPGAGFGHAGIEMAPQLQFNPKTVNGIAVESEVNIPLDFKAAGRMALPKIAPPPLGARLAAKQANGASVVNIAWQSAPTYEQVVAVYPERARTAQIGGLVALNCRFGRDGGLADCDVASETPGGYGFGRAAIALSRFFQGASADNTGASVEGDSTLIEFAFSPDMLTAAEHVIGRPKWVNLPEQLDVAASFPAAAAAAHVATGHVMLACDVAAGGRLQGCAVTRETPKDLGFGAAALALAPKFQVSLWTDEGLPTVGGKINVPLRYEAPAMAPPAKP